MYQIEYLLHLWYQHFSFYYKPKRWMEVQMEYSKSIESLNENHHKNGIDNEKTESLVLEDTAILDPAQLETQNDGGMLQN